MQRCSVNQICQYGIIFGPYWPKVLHRSIILHTSIKKSFSIITTQAGCRKIRNVSHKDNRLYGVSSLKALGVFRVYNDLSFSFLKINRVLKTILFWYFGPTSKMKCSSLFQTKIVPTKTATKIWCLQLGNKYLTFKSKAAHGNSMEIISYVWAFDSVISYNCNHIV